jgi:hypothetical protein
MGERMLKDLPGCVAGSAGAHEFPAATQAIRTEHIPEYAAINTSPRTSALAATDESSAALLHLAKVLETKMAPAAL